MMSKSINIPTDFSRFPAGRFISDGSFSGEKFRRDLLVPALRTADFVEVHFDGTLGYGSSFLEEAFGGLIRDGFASHDLAKKLKIFSNDDTLIAEVREYLGISLH
jgi:STAS-like domain of unknown function (DUF4325)